MNFGIPLDIYTLISVAISIGVLLLVLTFLKSKKKQEQAPEEDVVQRPRQVPAAVAGEGPRRGGRNVRARMRAAAARVDDDDDDTEPQDVTLPEGKIGVKKLRKLEAKAEKRKEREREQEEREERKQREKLIEEKRKQEELKEKEEEQKREEEEKALKEEQEKRELEEYLKLKETFSVEEEGFDEEENVDETNRFQAFLDYIKSQKVVLLEDLASRFKLKTQEAIDRVQELLAQEWLVGVIDDRGKFIYITREELESVAQFIRQRGRVSISELVDCSNSLINLQPDMSDLVSPVPS